MALSRQVCERYANRPTAWLSSGPAGADLAESFSVTKSCLDVVGGRTVVRDDPDHPGCSILLDSDTDRNSEKAFGLGSS